MSATRLSDEEAVSRVRLLDCVPASMPEPHAIMCRTMLQAARKSQIVSLWLAVWPDGVWATLGHNPEWPQPRAEQLVRAYRNAHFVGAYMPRVYPDPAETVTKVATAYAVDSVTFREKK